MNILIKLPALLGLNLLNSVYPGSEKIFERYVYNMYHFGSEQNQYSRSQFTSFINSLGKYGSLKNKTILEIGPGGSVGLGLLALKRGAKKYYAIDTGTHLAVKSRIYNEYSHLLGDKALLDKIFINNNENYILNPQLVRFLDITQKSIYPLPDDSIDIIYSCAVLEHAHNLDLCFSEMSRVLKPGGTMNHIVDLRDHVFSQKSLYFLEIPEYWFRFFFGNTGSYVNRKRFSYYTRLFSLNNLEVVSMKTQFTYKGNISPKLLKIYKKHDLQLLAFNIVLRKKT